MSSQAVAPEMKSGPYSSVELRRASSSVSDTSSPEAAVEDKKVVDRMHIGIAMERKKMSESSTT